MDIYQFNRRVSKPVALMFGLLVSLPSLAEQPSFTELPFVTEQPAGREDANASYLSMLAGGRLPGEIGSRWSASHHDDVDRHQLDSGTRLRGWQIGDGVYFGRSKGDTSGVALIWQRSQTQQVSLSGDGLRLTRRLR